MNTFARATPARSIRTTKAQAVRPRPAPSSAPVHVEPARPRAHTAEPARRRTQPCACGGSCPRCSAANAASDGAVRGALSRHGQPLPADIRQRTERQFGADLSDVRVHVDREAAVAAAQTQASAFTAGPHIVFGAGMYAPHTTAGYRRLTHEITHVLQQGKGAAGDRANPITSLEGEARANGERAGSDSSARFDVVPRAEAQGHLQRDDPPPWMARRDLLHPFTSQGQFRLQLSPEMQRLIWEMEFERWLAAQREAAAVPSGSAADATVPVGGESDPTVIAPPPAPSPEGPGPLGPRVPIPPVSGVDMTRTDEPDMGAIMEPFLTRGVPLGARDVDAAAQLYWRNYQWVRILPDPPEPFRSWIPSDWRRSVTESLTTSAINNSPLRFDFPTAIEAFDQRIMNMTGDPGAVPTYFNLPPYRF